MAIAKNLFVGTSQKSLNTENDLSFTRERERQNRLRTITYLLAATLAYLLFVDFSHRSFFFPLIDLFAPLRPYATAIALLVVMGIVVIIPTLGMSRSPHRTYRASQIDVSLGDIRGASSITSEIRNQLELFRSFRHFEETLGGTPPKGLLFEGPPGTGKTYIAKAIAHEAQVPFLFVSASAFQSMYYGQTNRKVRAYFRALRKAARKEGGAIGFIEEIDAIGAARSGMGVHGHEGVSGVVNELLVQMQSFDEPTKGASIKGYLVDFINSYLPSHRALKKPVSAHARILVIAATNRANDLDPALLRPGRFDKKITFNLPSHHERKDLLRYRLAQLASSPTLLQEDVLDDLAHLTQGYSPAQLENLLQEGLHHTLLRQSEQMSFSDLAQARLKVELGLDSPINYTKEDALRVATHEAGHAVVAYHAAKNRKLEVLSIIKRANALGLLAHAPREEKFSEDRLELEAQLLISLGGLCAEEHYFNAISTGPSSDLISATQIGAHMVGVWAMGRSLINIAAGSPGNIVDKVLNDSALRAELDTLLSDAKVQAQNILLAHLDQVECLRNALLERQQLLSQEIYALLES
jgi:ATP-dependent Zn protease